MFGGKVCTPVCTLYVDKLHGDDEDDDDMMVMI
jgi:hypothetical protein